METATRFEKMVFVTTAFDRQDDRNRTRHGQQSEPAGKAHLRCKQFLADIKMAAMPANELHAKARFELISGRQASAARQRSQKRRRQVEIARRVMSETRY